MRRFAVCTVLGMLAGCGSSEPPPPAPPPKKTVFDPMTRQVDEARHLAETLPGERKDTLDKAIDGDSR